MKPTPQFTAVMRRRREEMLLASQDEFTLVQELVFSALLDIQPPEQQLADHLRNHWRPHALALPWGWFDYFVRRIRLYVAQNPWHNVETSSLTIAPANLGDVRPLAKLLVHLRADHRVSNREARS